MYYSKSGFLITLFLFVTSCTNNSTPPTTTEFEDEAIVEESAIIEESVLSITDSLLQASDTTLSIIKEKRRTTIKKMDSLLNSTLRNELRVSRLNVEVENDIAKIIELENQVDSLLTEVKNYKHKIKFLQLNQSISDSLLESHGNEVRDLSNLNFDLKLEIKKQQEYIKVLSDSLEAINNRKWKLFGNGM